MRDIVFAVVTPDGANTRLRDITIAWSRYGYQGDILDASSIDQALQQACETQAEYCLIQRAGHIIDEQWYLDHWHREGFYQGLRRLMQQDDFIVAGEVIAQSDQIIGLAEDCLLVNLARYRDIGQPSFYDVDRSVQSINDQPNQRLLSSTKNNPAQNEFFGELRGSSVIQECKKHGYPVIGFGEGFNSCRFDLADDSNAEKFLSLMGEPIGANLATNQLTSAQAGFVKNAAKQFADAKRGVFLFNIESYDDLAMRPNSEPLDAVYSVAAGFKPYRILSSQGFHSQTKLVLFDYSQKALDVWRHISDNWDGVDFPNFVKGLFNEFPQEQVFYQLWHGTTPDSLNWDDMDMLWQKELQRWGGEKQFRDHWQKCQQLPREYLHCDLLQDRQQLLSSIKPNNRNYIWWSNAFFTIHSHWYYSPAERKQQYVEWITQLAKTAPHCLINGADHNNVAVNGSSASNYLEKFNRRSNDELTPQKFHRVEMQF